ncbi:wsv481 [White spot syndrome virus]|uniref:Wsv481 n=3 Tax=White spot syndrome virus TaxID=342409 RepID=Q8VAE4_WSSVS|nr:wsv481 [Shrimp white spot syndrome virus]AFX59855.1 wsv481 [White spot syndrome virus]AAL33482.1 wsv481 [Shrimp white spot syndrome virus]AAL88876.1 WSSV008 [Shrimp white spot syndrome virus]AWQ62288.1 wsv481 [Shrimp white spot syndrome virus]AWQ62704.1 wsv481 [Shrimp white spot syndrome virus]
MISPSKMSHERWRPGLLSRESLKTIEEYRPLSSLSKVYGEANSLKVYISSLCIKILQNMRWMKL